MFFFHDERSDSLLAAISAYVALELTVGNSSFDLIIVFLFERTLCK